MVLRCAGPLRCWPRRALSIIPSAPSVPGLTLVICPTIPHLANSHRRYVNRGHNRASINTPHPRSLYVQHQAIMTVDEATQVNGVPDPNAGVLDANKVQEKDWSIESGMS